MGSSVTCDKKVKINNNVDVLDTILLSFQCQLLESRHCWRLVFSLYKIHIFIQVKTRDPHLYTLFHFLTFTEDPSKTQIFSIDLHTVGLEVHSQYMPHLAFVGATWRLMDILED